MMFDFVTRFSTVTHVLFLLTIIMMLFASLLAACTALSAVADQHRFLHTTTQTVTKTVVHHPTWCATPPATGCQSYTIKPWTQFHIFKDHHGKPKSTTIHVDHDVSSVLYVTDTDYRNGRYEVSIDGEEILGSTSPVDLDGSLYCGADADKCISLGFSHGRFVEVVSCSFIGMS